jgi:hypothetical protein
MALDDTNRFRELETQTTTLDTRLSGVEETLANHTAKLDRIVEVLTTASARPQFDPIVIIGFIKDIAVVFAMVCAGIIYVSSNISSAWNAIIEHRVGQIEKTIHSNSLSAPK